MTMDRSGQSTMSARISPSANQTEQPKKPRLPRAALIVATCMAVIGLAFVARHALIGFVLTRGLGALSAQRVSFGAFRIGPAQSVLYDVHVVTPGGDRLLDIRKLTVRYSLHDAIWGGPHRYGLTEVTLDEPIFTILRHAAGDYNLSRLRLPGSGGAGGAAATTRNLSPLAFHARVRAGTIRFVDLAPVAADLAEQRLTQVALTAQIASDRRSTAAGSAALVGRRTAAAPLERWPIALSGFVDTGRGLGRLQARAATLPLRGAIGYVQHSRAVRVDDGLLTGFQMQLFALNLGLDGPPALHLGAGARLVDGRVAFAALQRPVRGLHGALTLLDDSVTTRSLGGTLAGVPLVARGGAYNRAAPELRVGLAATGDLAALRAIFAFSKKQPIAGQAHLETLIEAPAANLLIRSALHIAHGRYGKVPLTEVGGRVDYHAGAVVLDGIRARYGPASLSVGGRFLLGSVLQSSIAVTAGGPARALPYAENLAPEATVDVVALITGAAGYRARGAVSLQGDDVSGRGLFAVDERGVGEFGPFRFERTNGSTLVGALRLERPTSRSAAWISARGYRVRVPSVAARLGGLSLPAFPTIAGVVDADVAGGGAPDFFELRGTIGGHDLRVGSLAIGTGRAGLGGSLRDVRLDDLAVAGPLGNFRGGGVASGGALALRGTYDGSLEQLVPLTGRQRAYGRVRGPVAAIVDGRDVVVQSAGAILRGGSIRGVALDTAAGTIAVRKNTFHLLVARGSIRGRGVVARESNGRVAVSAPDVPSSALRGTGVPLEAGNVSAFGIADLRGPAPTFDGTVAVSGGRARGYTLSGDARIDLRGSRARISAATGALGSTFGSIGGSIEGIGEGIGAGALAYDLDTRVALGDLDLLRRDLGLPLRHLEGSFSADLRVRGAGTRPLVNGSVSIPEGSYNGLAFRDAGTRVLLDSGGAAATDGKLTVGSTRASVAASLRSGAFAFDAGSPDADLADFDDYFDASDTLAGRGRIALSFATAGGRISTGGRLDLRGVRYRGFLLGDTAADWATLGPTLRGRLNVTSPAGSVGATATIVPAVAGDPIRAFRAGGYDVRATFAKIELGTWLPAAGLTQPILGDVDAGVTVRGRLPNLAVAVDASLEHATIAGYAVRNGHIRATSVGSRINVVSSSADLGFVQLAGDGRLGLAPGDPLAFDLRASSADVGPAIRTFVPALHGFDVAGALEADIRLGGTRSRPKVESGVDLTNARYGSFSVPRAIGALALAGSSVELRDFDVEFSRGQAFVAGSLPLQLRPFGLGPAHAPLSFDVTARGVDLAQFEPLFPAGTKLGGTIDGRFGVEGSVDRPRLLGSLAVDAASYRSAFERAPIQHVTARLAFAGTSIALPAFHADVGTGTLDASGKLTLPFGADPHAQYALDVRAKAAALDFPAYGRGTFDGMLRLTGGGGQPLLAGTIGLRDAIIPVAAVYGSGSGPAVAGAGRLPIDPLLAIAARVGNNVRVQNGIVDIGVTGGLDVAGSVRAPRLGGALTATDGTVSSYNHVFRVVSATATFNPADGFLPTIDARATSRVTNPDPDPSRNIAGSANIIVTVSGTPDSNNLQVTYSSDPPYSQEQIVGLLLDVPALLGAVNFDLNGARGGTLLRGAPGETNVLLPPGVTPEQVSAISFNQEVFSLLNGQFTQRALTPIERVFEKVFGLSDVQFTVDYGGGIGYSLRRQIGKRNFYAFLSQTVTYPERSNVGFELEPKPFETLNFSYYEQNGVTSLITNATPGGSFLSSTRRLTSVQPLGNRSGFSINYNRRF